MTKRKKYNRMQNLQRAAIGLRITWEDKTPTVPGDTISKGAVAHRNPMLRPLAMKLWQSDFGASLIDKIPARWLVTITGIFDYPNGMTQRETRELEARCRLTSINDVAIEQIEDIQRHGGGQYRTTEFCVECVGA